MVGAQRKSLCPLQDFVARLYSYWGKAQPNRNMDPKLLHALRIYCPNFDGDSDIVAPFDATTQFLFDHAYYGNLLKKLGMLASDQALALEPRTKSIVQDLAKDKQKFIQAFVGAMDKLS